jgi:hypothetical protein
MVRLQGRASGGENRGRRIEKGKSFRWMIIEARTMPKNQKLSKNKFDSCFKLCHHSNTGAVPETQNQTYRSFKMNAQLESVQKTKFLSKDYDEETGDFWFELGNGKRFEGNVKDYSEGIQLQLCLHGVMQRGGDSAAGNSKTQDYESAEANITRVLEGLKNGQWETRGEGGERGPRLGELVGAIARLRGVGEDEAKKLVEAAQPEKIKQWRDHPKIKHAIAQIKLEKAQAELAGAGEGDFEV